MRNIYLIWEVENVRVERKLNTLTLPQYKELTRAYGLPKGKVV